MSIEKAISIQCMDIGKMHQHFIEQQSKGFIEYNPVALAKVSQIVNHDCLNELYKLSDHVPSLHRLDLFQNKLKHFVALSDFAYTLHNARFTSEHHPVLEQKWKKLNDLIIMYSKLCSSLTKSTSELSLEEAKAIAWDSLPSISEYEHNDYLAIVKNPFGANPEYSFMGADQSLYKLRFFKSYINEVCVGWEFFRAE
jgi:hypothetical protein